MAQLLQFLIVHKRSKGWFVEKVQPLLLHISLAIPKSCADLVEPVRFHNHSHLFRKFCHHPVGIQINHRGEIGQDMLNHRAERKITCNCSLVGGLRFEREAAPDLFKDRLSIGVVAQTTAQREQRQRVVGFGQPV